MTNLLSKIKRFFTLIWTETKAIFQDSVATKRANEIEKLEALKTKIKSVTHFFILRKPKAKKKKTK